MSKVPRLYLSADSFEDSTVTLSKDHQHYLQRVLRLRSGDQFIALDGEKQAWLCSLGEKGNGRFLELYQAAPIHPLQLTVGLALCKGARFESALERLAELGAKRVLPLHTERTERKSPSPQKLERWRQIARSASALAYRLQPLEVSEPTTLQAARENFSGRAIYCHPSGASPKELLSRADKELLLLIGPEGGFSPSEESWLSESAEEMTLGAYNLRVETAAALAAGLAIQLYQGM